MKYSKHMDEKLALQGYCCYYCKDPLTLENATRDHFLPKVHGHKLNDNTVLACQECNIIKAHHTIDELREKLIHRIKHILRNVVARKFRMKAKERDKFAKYSKMLKTCTEIINNNYKPLLPCPTTPSNQHSTRKSTT